MGANAIRILDTKDEVVSVKLSDILATIRNGEQLFWSFLLLDSVAEKEYVNEISEFEKEISHSLDGKECDWNELIKLAPKLFQEIDLILIGCKNRENLHRYLTDDEMYEKCEVVIEMIDSSYWEIHSPYLKLLELFEDRFNNTVLLDSD